MMCRGLTDLSPDSQSSGGPQFEEEEEPESESIATQHQVGGPGSSSHAGQTGRDEQFREDLDAGDGYFTSASMPSAEQDQQNDEENDDEEIEDSETESHRRFRYI